MPAVSSTVPGLPARRTLLRGVEQWTLATILAIAGAVFAFIKLADEVLEGETHHFDVRLLMALRDPLDPASPLGPRWLGEAMRDITALGSTVVLTLVTLAAIGFLLVTRKRHAAVAVAVAVLVGLAMVHGLKLGFDRPRPDLVPHGTLVVTQSFPSGHAMLSAIVYLTLGALLARTQARRRVKAYLFALATVVTLVVGSSRVYLGVHWPTDVIAGWSLGAGWAMLCQLVMLRLQRRGEIEPPTGDT